MNLGLEKPLDEVLRRSLRTLFGDLSSPSWYGREREIVSLFAFGHLVRLCRKSGVLFDPAQIGIEVAVPQINRKSGAKAYVCKDVVIWRSPKMTSWNTEGRRNLLCVIEFKSINRNDAKTTERRKKAEHRSDVDWLCRTSKLAAGFVGYAVLIDQRSRVTLKCARALNGRAAKKWLSLGWR